MGRRTGAAVAALILALALVVACASEAEEPITPADFLRGKTINLIVSAKAGSISDRVARAIVPYLERDTGAIVVVTNKGGASGLDGINSLYRTEPDGLTLGIVASGKFVPNRVMDEPAAAYEIEEFSYIMTIGHRLWHFMVSPDGPYQSIAGLQAGKDIKIGGSSPSGTVSLGGMTVIDLLNLDARVVTGINGESARALAAKRGEIAGYAMSVEGAITSIDSGMVKPILVLATERDPKMPDIPAITEQGNMTEEEVELAELWETALVTGDIFTAPPGMPRDRLTFLRDLADKWIEDDEFREDINRVSGYDVQKYVGGDIVAETMLNLTNSMDKFRAIFAELIEKYRA